MFRSHKIGAVGEKEAVKFFKQKGFRLIDKNYRKPWGEIDLVVLKEKNLRFIEVKTVTFRGGGDLEAVDFYRPEDNLHYHKLKRLGRVIETYLLDKDVAEDIDYQIDSLAVYLDDKMKVQKFDWLENIF